jgi:hypothetical protein
MRASPLRRAESGSAFVPVAEAQWRDLLCIQEEGVVASDNTVAWQWRRLQIPPHPARAHVVRATVRVHEYVDGSIAITLISIGADAISLCARQRDQAHATPRAKERASLREGVLLTNAVRSGGRLNQFSCRECLGDAAWSRRWRI